MIYKKTIFALMFLALWSSWFAGPKLWAGCMYYDCDEMEWREFLWPDKGMMGYVDENATIWYTSLNQAKAAIAGGEKVIFFQSEVDYSSQALDELLKELQQFPDLKHLQINFKTGRDIAIPPSIGNLTQLMSLNLDAKYPIGLPASITKLKHLLYLGIRSDYSQGIPMEICQLSSLEFLDLSNNSLQKLPDCIGSLLNLYFLKIRSNPLRELPKSILNLVNTKIKLGLNPYTLPRHLDPSAETDKGNINLRFPNKKSRDLLAFYFPGTQAKNIQLHDSYAVKATSGLSVRSNPSLNGKKLGVMPYDLHIQVLEKGTKVEKIGNKSASWYKVRTIINHQIQEGWVWSGYLKKNTYKD